MTTIPVYMQPPCKPHAEVLITHVPDTAKKGEVLQALAETFRRGFDPRDVIDIKLLGKKSHRGPRWSAVYAYEFSVGPAAPLPDSP